MLTQIFLTAFCAVAPIVALICLGYLLKRFRFLNDNFIQTGNRLVFNICLPVMLFVNIYHIDTIRDVRWDMVLYCMLVLALLFGLGWFLGRVGTKDPQRRGVIWQCAVRSNFAIIGLPLAQTLAGEQGAAVAAVLSAFAIPAFNVFGVVALSAYTGKRKGTGAVLKSIATNPLILGVAAGLAALLIRAAQTQILGRIAFSVERDMPFLFGIMNELKAMTTPLALIILGGQCVFSAAKGMRREIVVAVSARVLVAPLVAICGATALSAAGVLVCGNGEYAALIALFGSPVAVSSAIMAGNMNNDHQLATQLVVWTSILSVATIFLAVCVLMGTGLLTV